MDELPYYPRFETSAKKWLSQHPEIEVSEEKLREASELFYQINQEYYDEKLLIENHLSNKRLEESKFVHTLRLQELFEDTFGEDAWDDRHEIYLTEE